MLNKDLAHNAYFSRLANVSTNPASTQPCPSANVTPPTFGRSHFCARVTFAEVAHKMWNPFPLASSSPSPPPSLKPLQKFILSAVSPQANSTPISLPQLSESFRTYIFFIAYWPSNHTDGDNVIKITPRLEVEGNNAAWNTLFTIWLIKVTTSLLFFVV